MSSSHSSASFIRFTPISGARQDLAPACYILEIDQVKILLDCGSTSSLDVSHLHSLKKYVAKHKIDAVIVSHASLKYLGGLPYVYGVLGVNCPILATLPVHHLGLITLYDAYQSYQLTFGNPPEETSLDHIDKVFEHMTMLRYAQTFYLPGSSIMISAIPAGHTVGGAIWRIKKGEETVVYAPAFNHKRETHLDGAPFDLLSKSTLMITGADQALQIPVLRKSRDESFLETIVATTKAGGNVLIPVDTASRSLELIQLLESHWTSNKKGTPLVLLSYQAKRTVEMAKGMLEWMGQSMMKCFENDRRNPFELIQFRLCTSMADLHGIAEPKVVLASLDSLDSGFARSLFASWASQSKSLILFTSPPPPASLGHRLLNDPAKGPKVTLRIFEQVPLEGEELRAHQQAIQDEKDRVVAEAAFAELKRRRLAEEEVDLEGIDGDEDGDEDADTMASTRKEGPSVIDKINSARALREIYWTDHRTDWHVQSTDLVNGAEKLTYPLLLDGESTGTDNLIRHQMFPFQHYKKRPNEYGMAVDPSEFQSKDSIVPETAIVDERKPVAPVEKAKVPTKLIDYNKEITVRCKRQMIEFSGLVDGRSLRTIISQIDPKKLILIGAAEDPTDYLQSHFHFQEDAEFCNAPAVWETVRISLSSNTKQVVLSQSVIDQLSLCMWKDLELAYVKARIELRRDKFDADGPDAMDVDVDAGVGVDEIVAPQAVVLEAPEDGVYAAQRKPILLGEPKLHELRAQIIGKLSLSAEFVSGDLIIADGRLRLKRTEDRISLEGSANEAWYQVRDLLYSQLAII